MLDGFFSAAEPYPVDGNILGLLVPHAGYRFSGRVAAHGFASVKDLAFETVVVIGPMHYPTSAPILTTAHEEYETPLGTVPVDQTALATLNEVVGLKTVRRDPEHSVEIQLPFLQTVLRSGFTLIPLMLADQTWPVAMTLGAALAGELAEKNALVVASSDLSHFYPQAAANEFDQRMLACIEAIDPQRVIDYNRSGAAFACGSGAVATMLSVMRAWGGTQAHIVDYQTSGDITGDYDQVVGYGTAVFWRARSSPQASAHFVAEAP